MFLTDTPSCLHTHTHTHTPTDAHTHARKVGNKNSMGHFSQSQSPDKIFLKSTLRNSEVLQCMVTHTHTLNHTHIHIQAHSNAHAHIHTHTHTHAPPYR